MSTFVPMIRILPGFRPSRKESHEKLPSDYKNFGPDDTANAVRVFVEACKIWPDEFVLQIEYVDISWEGYFQPSFHVVVRQNNSWADCWEGTVALESRFQSSQEIVDKGQELAAKLIEDLGFYFNHLAPRISTLSDIVTKALLMKVAARDRATGRVYIQP